MLYSNNVDRNPYLKKFWEWFPELIKTLKVLRITGGEPLLSDDTFKVIDFLNSNPAIELELMINTNLSIPTKVYELFLKNINQLLLGKKIKAFSLYTSLDSVSDQAEYIRAGLNYSLFLENLKKYCSQFPQSDCVIMCTYSILSIPKFHLLLEEILKLKKQYSNIILDISYLKDPEYLSPKILNNELLITMEKDLRFLIKNHSNSLEKPGFSSYEISKYKRILVWVKNQLPKTHEKELSDFYVFNNEFSKRKSSSFCVLFPELRGLYNLGKKYHFKNSM